MWLTKTGDCNCYFCQNARPHSAAHQRWDTGGHLQVAESLDPKDILRTRICMTCGHEELASNQSNPIRKVEN